MRCTFLTTSLIIISILSISCSKKEDSGSSSQASFSYSEEPEFCNNVRFVADSVTINSRAQYLARQVSSSGLLGPGPAENIKYAEVEVVSSNGSKIQCGTTDENGTVSIAIPKVPGTYILKVYSRADSSSYKVSVLNSPSQNLPYFIQVAFTVSAETASLTAILPIAPFDGTLEGGAFNIMDQVYRANLFIRQNSGCPSQGSVCTAFSVAPKTRVYWMAGFSPYSYYGSPSTALSFYSRLDDPSVGIRRGLYIQGGIKGDSICSDTDHFDNSVILHEYGHFLEDSFAKSDSPGGSHSGNALIDPRLAWSEGWSNFFQTAVLGTAVYRDTIGNSACAGGTFLGVNLNIEVPVSGQDKMNSGTLMGEGVFREVSVARVLWDTIDSSGADGGAGLGFALVWKVFSDKLNGFQSSNVHFRSIGLFNQFLRDLVANVWPAKIVALDAALVNEYQVSNSSVYAQPLNPQSAGICNFSLQGVPDVYSMGNFVSHLQKSNNFFEIHYDGSFSNIELHYSSAVNGQTPSDLDLFLYTEEYVYDEDSSILATSARRFPESAGSGLELLNMSGLPFGTYLLNVRVNTDHLSNAANYYLTTSTGARFCP